MIVKNSSADPFTIIFRSETITFKPSEKKDVSDYLGKILLKNPRLKFKTPGAYTLEELQAKIIELESEVTKLKKGKKE